MSKQQLLRKEISVWKDSLHWQGRECSTNDYTKKKTIQKKQHTHKKPTKNTKVKKNSI